MWVLIQLIDNLVTICWSVNFNLVYSWIFLFWTSMFCSTHYSKKNLKYLCALLYSQTSLVIFLNNIIMHSFRICPIKFNLVKFSSWFHHWFQSFFKAKKVYFFKKKYEKNDRWIKISDTVFLAAFRIELKILVLNY